MRRAGREKSVRTPWRGVSVRPHEGPKGSTVKQVEQICEAQSERAMQGCRTPRQDRQDRSVGLSQSRRGKSAAEQGCGTRVKHTKTRVQDPKQSKHDKGTEPEAKQHDKDTEPEATKQA